MYKITCSDVDFLGTSTAGSVYRGVKFEATGYTNDPNVAEDFRTLGYHRGDESTFRVEEVTE